MSGRGANLLATSNVGMYTVVLVEEACFSNQVRKNARYRLHAQTIRKQTKITHAVTVSTYRRVCLITSPESVLRLPIPIRFHPNGVAYHLMLVYTAYPSLQSSKPKLPTPHRTYLFVRILTHKGSASRSIANIARNASNAQI